MKRALITWIGSDGQQFRIEIDVTTREVHTFNNSVSDHPVETGSNISDNIRPEPNVLAIDGIISNAPHYLPGDHTGGAELIGRDIDVPGDTGYDNRQTVKGVAPRLSGLVRVPFGLGDLIPVGAQQSAQIGRQVRGMGRKVRVQTFSTEFDRVRDVMEELISLRDLGQLLTVELALRTYDNMGIQNFECSRQGGDPQHLAFSMTLKQVRFGITEIVAVPALPTKRTSKGAVTPTDDSGTDGDRTWLKNFLGLEDTPTIGTRGLP